VVAVASEQVPGDIEELLLPLSPRHPARPGPARRGRFPGGGACDSSEQDLVNNYTLVYITGE